MMNKEKKMKVKIKGCALPSYWYLKCIGLVFDVYKTTVETEDGPTEIFKLSSQEEGKYINIKDCEIVEEQEKYIAVYVGMDNTYDLGVFEFDGYLGI